MGDHHEFEAILGYIASSYLKTKRKKERKRSDEEEGKKIT